MLLFSDPDRKLFSELEMRYEQITGSKHESASSLADYQDCREKGRFRKMYRGVSVPSLLGSIFHEFLNTITQELMRRCISGNAAYDSVRKQFLTEDFKPVFERVMHRVIGDIPIDVITGKLTCKDKDKVILKNPAKIKHICMTCFKAFTPDVLSNILDEPPLASEVGGYLEYCSKCLLYGYIDKISMVNDDTIRALDYKFKFSTKGKLLTPRYLFQIWIYDKMIKDQKLPTIKNVLKTLRYLKLPLPSNMEIFFKTPEELLRERNEREVIKAAEQGRKPRTYKTAPEPLSLEITIEDKNIEFTSVDDERYKLKLDTLLMLKQHNLGFIGESTYGCNFCDYKEHCEQYKNISALDSIETDSEVGGDDGNDS